MKNVIIENEFENDFINAVYFCCKDFLFEP